MDKMDKEDILVRSRNDNRKGDEREVQNRTNAELFSYWIVIVILFVTALLSDAGVIGGEIFINGRSFLFKDFVWLLNFLKKEGSYQMNQELVLKNRLKEARAEKGLSQQKLSELVGVSRNTISSIETGQFCPTAKLALVLCIALDKKFEELFFFE